MVSGSSPEAGRLATKSPGCENSEKYDSTKLKRVQFQNKCALLEVWDLHHEDVMLVFRDDSKGDSSFT